MKRISRFPLVLLFLLAILALPSCQTGSVPVGELDGILVPIMQRHDRYVSTDDTLTEADRAMYLRSTEIMRAIVTEASTQ